MQTKHQAKKETNNLFYDFLWNGKGDKIKRNIMIQNYLAVGA